MTGSVRLTDTRLHVLDILRGLALFGMILVHFHQRMRVEVTGVEDLIGWAVYILVEGKAWGTFAFLFGAGFAILLRRLDARGLPVWALYLRRLAALAVFGVIAEVGFGFHILFTYAMSGVLLLCVRRWLTAALLLIAALSVIARPATYDLTGPPEAVSTSVAGLRRTVAVAAEQGTYSELLSARWALFAATTPGNWRRLLPDVNFALFLLGLLAVRHGLLDEPRNHSRAIAWAMTFGFTSWLLVWIGVDWNTYGLVQDQWLCLTYIGAALFLFSKYPVWIDRMRHVGAAGRLALTNYMVQAIVLDALASGYGLGLKLRPALYVLAAFALFALEAALATAWLSRHRYGPLEWLWRSVTYWRGERNIIPLAARSR